MSHGWDVGASFVVSILCSLILASFRQACDKTLPVCGRCLRSKNPNMKCTYRNEDVDALGSAAKSLGVEQAARDDFIQEAKEFVTRRRTTACFACRVDKRSCEGGGDGACDRCQHKGLVCVFPDQQQQNSSSSEYLLPNNASSSKKKRTSPPMSSVRARPPRRAGDSNKRDNNHGTPSLSPAIVESTSFSSSRWSEHSSILPGGQTMDWFPSTEGGTAIGSSNAVGLPARTFPLLDSDSTIGFGGQSTTPLHFFPGGIPFQQGTTRSLPTELGLLAEVLGLAGRRQAPFASRTAVSPFSLSTSIPIAPSSGWFPDNSTILQCIDIYFAQADITLVMLHKNKVLAAKTHPDLLICSILLVAPHMSHEPVVGRSTPVEVRLWDKWIFQRIKSEMFALFSSSGGDERVTVVALAAVMNLVLWSLFQGLHVLSRQLTVLGRRLLQVLGLVEDAVTLRPPQDLPSWKQVMVAAFGPDVYQRTLTPQESALLRDMWIDYHVRERVAALVLYFSWISKDWLREIDLNADTAFGYPELSRWMPPMPHVWEASFSPSFDPRVLEEPPLLIDVLSPLFMVSNEPRRPAAFARLTEYFVNQRKTVTWVFLILRDQVDKFLAACHEAGYSTPAMLRAVDDDTLFSTMNFRTRELIRRRNQLDETIKLTRASFPPQIITGLESGNANDIVACLMEYSGSFHYAFNHATYFPAIVLLRMELYSSCGVYLTVSGVTDSGSNGDRAAQQDTLAEEFASGGRLFAEFLEDVSRNRETYMWKGNTLTSSFSLSRTGPSFHSPARIVALAKPDFFAPP